MELLHYVVDRQRFKSIVNQPVVEKPSLSAQSKGVRFVRNPGRDISFTIFIRKEIETRKLERKSKQKISCLIDLLYRLNDIISR